MSKALWCWRCKMDVPMLDEAEWTDVVAPWIKGGWNVSASDGKVELQELPPGDGELKKPPRGFRRKLDRLRGVAPFFLVAQAGRGRMPLRSVDDQQPASCVASDPMRLEIGMFEASSCSS